MKRISKNKAIYAMSKDHSPVERISSGETIIFETCDCYNDQLISETQHYTDINQDQGNPATGPLFIEGAEPGDMLKVEILDIKVASHGTMSVRPGVGVLQEQLDGSRIKVIPIEDGLARFNDQLSFPIQPMIGVIGVAPEEGSFDTIVPEAHGGNMDCNRIVKGATVYLPVFIQGALLAMGDLHALMGDGEVVICGLETKGEVTVKVSVIKDKSWPLPMVVSGDEIITIASRLTLDEASRQAAMNMHQFLVKEVNLDAQEAGMLLSLLGNLRICQVVDPLMTGRMEFPRWVLDKYDYKLM